MMPAIRGRPHRDVALSAQEITVRYLSRLELSLRAEAREAKRHADQERALHADTWAERCQELKRFAAERLIPCVG